MPTAKWRKEHQEELRAYRRKHYHKNKEHYKSRVRSRITELRIWVRDLKASFGCSRCAENHPTCLDFHHKDPNHKVANLSEAIGNGWSKERLLIEISKCEILCSNCHRKEHFPI